MFDRKTLKTRAKFVLSQSYFNALLACLIASLFSGGIAFGTNFGANVNLKEIANGTSAIDNIANLNFYAATALFAVIFALVIILAISIFVSAPINVGLKNFMLRMSDGDARLDNLFTPFKTGYLNIVKVQFIKNLYITLWSLLALIPVFVGIFFFDIHKKIYHLLNIQSPSFSSVMSLMLMIYGLLAITLIFYIPAFIKKLQYLLVDYLLADNPHMTRHDAIYKSKEMMVGNKWAYIKLMFSFLPLYFISYFVCCGLGSVFIIPYIEQTYAQMYLEISGNGKDYSGFEFHINGPFGGFGM